MTFHDVAALDELPPGAQRTVQVGGAQVLLCHEAGSGQVWAVHNRCPHAFQPLAGGTVSGGTLQCPKHGACFDLSTGASTNAVTSRPVPVFAVALREGRILVSLQPIAMNGSR